MTTLFEGLKEGDLESLVLSMISIDEYESKLDDDSIVIAFFVQDRDPAADLNRFIQKGATALLDTDVSPAPNEDGYYMVFVELLRDQDFPNKVLAILGSLKGLTGIENWHAAVYDVEDTIDITEETLRQYVRLESTEDQEGEDESAEEEEDEVDESITEFFRNSDLHGMVLEGRQLTLSGLVSQMNFTLVDFGAFDMLQERNAVLSQALRLDETAQHNVSRLQALLGDLWVVEHLENHVLLSNCLSEEVALLRL